MTRQVLFVQGGGAGVHDQWDNKLVDSLSAALGNGYAISYPLMPDEAEPDYERWAEALRRELTRLGDGTILVAHSIGAAIAINALAAKPPPVRLGAIMLIAAPFVGLGGWDPVGFAPREHLGTDLPDGVPVYLYHGSDDQTAPVAHVALYAKAIPQAVVRQIAGRDHQLGNDLREVAADIAALR